MRSPAVAVLQMQLTSSVDVHVEVEALTARLAYAEQRHQEARDHYHKQTELLAKGRRANVAGALRAIENAAALAAGVRSQLENKKSELSGIEAAEAAAAAEHRHQQELDALQKIEADIQVAKAALDCLKARYAQLPLQIQAAEWRFGQLLRGCNEARKQLGLR